jgi:hypothetical protein
MGEEGNERSMRTYDVALWCSWPALFPDYVGCIQATGTYSALVLLMETVRVEKVAHAAVRQVEHPRIDRWSKVYMPLTAEKRGQRYCFGV